MTIPALREFILKQGPSRNVTTMDWGAFWATNKKEIDPVAPRHTAICQKEAVKVAVTGSDAPTSPVLADRPLHPKNKDVGTKKVAFSSEVIIEQEDAKLMKSGEEITLMAWGNAFVRDIQGADGQPVTGMTIELNLAGDVKKTEKKITWLAAEGQTLIPGEIWDFDYLITKDKLEEDDNVDDFLNPNTATMEDVWCAETMSNVKENDIIQLERKGFYRVDKGLGDWKNGEEGKKGKRIVMFCIPTGRAN